MHFLRKEHLTKAKIKEYREKYETNNPYPHIEIDGLFNNLLLTLVERSFPNIERQSKKDIRDGGNLKISSREGCQIAKGACKHFLRYLNSYEFVNFVQKICNIERELIVDHTLLGGGFHSTGKGGSLGMHIDFPIHKKTNLDRRVNVLVYLNKNWDERWGGEFIAADEKDAKEYLPIFNKTLIFETNDYTIHGHPYPLKCPENRRRNSIAMYYYTNGRPDGQIKYPMHNEETNKKRSTIFFPTMLKAN